jgi:hypothetical protein
MRQHFVLVIALLLAGIGAALPTSRAAACSCAMSTPEQSLGFADAAFVGTVVADRAVQVLVAGFDPMPGTVTTFEVESSAKAVSEPSIEITSVGDSAMCGTTFALQQRYLIFATISDGRLESGLCSGNVELAAGESAPLPVVPIAPAPTPAPGSEAPPMGLLALGALGALGVVGGIAFLALRRSARAR